MSNTFYQKSIKILHNSLNSVKGSCTQIITGAKNALPSQNNFKPKDLFTTKCEIPLFIVPSGYTPNDYKIYADFSLYEEISKNSYKIPLPQIEAYSAHSLDKFDFKMFQDTFILTFSDYFHSSMKNIHEEYDDAKKIEQIKSEEFKKEESSLLGRWFPVLGAVGVMAIATNPLIDLLFLLVALTGGCEAIKELLKTIKDNAMSILEESNIDNAYQKDIKELKRKEALVRKALSDTELIIHPGLVALQELIANSNKINSSVKRKITVSKPSLLPILYNHNFLSSFPQETQLKMKQYLPQLGSSN